MKILGPTVVFITFLLAACTPQSEPVNDSRLTCPDCPILEVTRIIDGDTFDSPRGRVRLFGVDTPERDQMCYQAATDRLREIAGDTVTVQPGPRAFDAYGRLLYYIYTSSGDSIDEALIREGFGTAWRRDGQHQDYLYRTEIGAKVENRGCLW